MTARSRCGNLLGIILSLAGGAMLASVARADCYRYISGDASSPGIKDSCLPQLNVPPIFVQITEEGYDLLIPTSSEDPNSTAYRRAAAAVMWLESGTNLEAAEAVVDAMVTDTDFVLPLGTSRIEQINYTLAGWLNTSGATTSITSAANNPNETFAAGNCPSMYPHRCSACMWFFCWPDWMGGSCHCEGLGTTCCVIGRRLEPPQ